MNWSPSENSHFSANGGENRAQTYQCDSVSAENIPTHAVRVGEVGK